MESMWKESGALKMSSFDSSRFGRGSCATSSGGTVKSKSLRLKLSDLLIEFAIFRSLRPKLRGPSYPFFAILSAGLLTLLKGQEIHGCPSAIFGHEVLPKLAGIRENLHLFVAQKKPSKHFGVHQVGERIQWQRIPHQIDLVDEAGHIHYSDLPFMRDPLDQSDLIMLAAGSFGEKIDVKHDVFPCRSKGAVEIRDLMTDRYAYFVQCDEMLKVHSFPSVVSFDREKNLLSSRYYRYEFNNLNYMQFKKINLRDSGSDSVEVARDSKLVITSDVKNFFTLHFDSRQIESNLEKSRLGPLANLARLSFFLRILFFKLDMSLSTDVAFFEDSGHIPMMINLPVDSYRYLNPKSGILYTWIVPQSETLQNYVVQMPTLSPEEVSKGWKSLGKIGMKTCEGVTCSYHFSSLKGNRALTMKMEIANHLVGKGFFPQFVPDVEQFKQSMDWEIEIEKPSKRIGLYFEFSGLPKGGHPWSFWLKMSPADRRNYQCPRKISLRLLD